MRAVVGDEHAYQLDDLAPVTLGSAFIFELRGANPLSPRW